VRLLAALPIVLAGCALNADVAVTDTAAPRAGIVECAAPPPVIRTGFRHTGSRVFASLGDPVHRGIDLIAVDGDEHQTLGGKLAYSAADKDIEDEDVEVHACLDQGWQRLGRPRTDRDGRFELMLTGAQRLPAGMRDRIAVVPGDGTSVRFLAYVAAPTTRAIVSDVDGTLSESEDAVLNTVVFGDDIAHQPDAPDALAAARRPIIYVTARGDQFTEVTRLWLRVHGFPRGPLRLARASITAPGAKTVAFKTRTLRELAIPVVAAVGNRASDVEAYTRAGLPPDRIFIKLPEFTKELRDDLMAKRAVGFERYRTLATLLP
jgi:phosphatidate phosphatase PAH1